MLLQGPGQILTFERSTDIISPSYSKICFAVAVVEAIADETAAIILFVGWLAGCLAGCLLAWLACWLAGLAGLLVGLVACNNNINYRCHFLLL